MPDRAPTTRPRRSRRSDSGAANRKAVNISQVNRLHAALNAVLSAESLAATLRGDAHAVHYVSPPLGPMLIKLAGHLFEYGSSRAGQQYYRCVQQQRLQCRARVLKVGQAVYVIGDGRHCHEAGSSGADAAGMSEHVVVTSETERHKFKK